MSTSSASSVSVAELSSFLATLDFTAGFFEIRFATTSTSSVSAAELSSFLATRDFTAGFFEVRLFFRRARVFDVLVDLVFGCDVEEEDECEEADAVGAVLTWNALRG